MNSESPTAAEVIKSPALLLATWWGTGLSPRAPGTVGSLAALPYYMLGASAVNFQFLLVGFVLFRFFDIAKPWPVSYFDNHWKSGWGVMLDDVVAGLLAGLGALLVLPMLG